MLAKKLPIELIDKIVQFDGRIKYRKGEFVKTGTNYATPANKCSAICFTLKKSLGLKSVAILERLTTLVF